MAILRKWLHGRRFCKQWLILHYFTYHLTPMTTLSLSSYRSPNLLQYLEMWEKFESNVLWMSQMDVPKLANARRQSSVRLNSSQGMTSRLKHKRRRRNIISAKLRLVRLAEFAKLCQTPLNLQVFQCLIDFSFQCCLPFVKYNNGPASAFWLQQSGFHFRQEDNSLRVIPS